MIIMYYFTADNHFGHENVIEFCNRPFKGLGHMHEEMIKRWNSVVKPEDTVFVLGDFMFRSIEPTFNYLCGLLNGEIILIRGNHDRNNGVKTPIDEMVITLFKKKILLVHNYYLYRDRFKDYDLVFCGHIHDKWKFYDDNVINVGVDVWGYYPVHIRQILKAYHKYKYWERNIFIPTYP